MPHKKPTDQPPEEDQALIDKVDALMNLETKAQPPAAVAPPTTNEQPIDIFKDLGTAPPVEVVAEKPRAVEPEPVAEAPEEVIPEQTLPAAEPVVVEQTQVPKPTRTKISFTEDTGELDDEQTNKAVEEIIVAESDALLAAEDKASTVKPPIKPKHKGFFKKLFK